MSKRRRPGPDNPAQWIGQPYMPDDPYYLLGMGKSNFRNLPFPWVPFRRARAAATPPGSQRRRQRSGMNADVAVPGLPPVSRHAKRPAPMQAMPLISNPWATHPPYYDPTEKHSPPGLAMIWLAAKYPKSSCLVSVLLFIVLTIGWVWLSIFAFLQSGGNFNLWGLLAACLIFGPILAAFGFFLKGAFIAALKARPRRRRANNWRRRRSRIPHTSR